MMRTDTESDENIVEKVLSGDREMFAEIIERYKNRIYSIGYRFFYNPDDANDFCQEVFVKVYEKLHTYRFNSPFRYWIGRIAYNHGINQKNRKQYTCETCTPVEAESPESLNHSVEQEEISLVLRDAVNTLPDEYRICIDLYYFWGLSYPQVSSITEFPVNTIKSYVFRARKILRDRLRGTIAEDYHEM